jgi:hypothetical protein
VPLWYPDSIELELSRWVSVRTSGATLNGD